MEVCGQVECSVDHGAYYGATTCFVYAEGAWCAECVGGIRRYVGWEGCIVGV